MAFIQTEAEQFLGLLPQCLFLFIRGTIQEDMVGCGVIGLVHEDESDEPFRNLDALRGRMYAAIYGQAGLAASDDHILEIDDLSLLHRMLHQKAVDLQADQIVRFSGLLAGTDETAFHEPFGEPARIKGMVVVEFLGLD